MKRYYTAFLALVTFAGVANATGIKMKVYDCGGGSGEYAATVKVDHLSGSAPGGPVWHQYIASASHSWLGGTHNTGSVNVTPIFGGLNRYVNNDANFALTVWNAEQNAHGNVSRIDVSGSFRDPASNMTFNISRRWLNCR